MHLLKLSKTDRCSKRWKMNSETAVSVQISNVSVCIYLFSDPASQRASETHSEISQKNPRGTWWTQARNTSSDISLYNLLLYAWFKVNSACRTSDVWRAGEIEPLNGLTCLWDTVWCSFMISGLWPHYNDECYWWNVRGKAGPPEVLRWTDSFCLFVLTVGQSGGFAGRTFPVHLETY